MIRHREQILLSETLFRGWLSTAYKGIQGSLEFKILDPSYWIPDIVRGTRIPHPTNKNFPDSGIEIPLHGLPQDRRFFKFHGDPLSVK